MHGEQRGTGPVGFDLDMTLIDSRRAILATWSALAAESAVAVDLAEVDRRLGAKLEDEVAHWFPPDQRDGAAASYRRHYLTVAAELTSALPGAPEALAAVREAGESAVIITAKHEVSVGPSPFGWRYWPLWWWWHKILVGLGVALAGLSLWLLDRWDVRKHLRST